MITKILAFIATVVCAFFILGGWFYSVLPEMPNVQQLEKSMAEDIDYLQTAVAPTRGKILMVVTSASQMGNTGKATGYELTELARPYWVFTVNGFDVDIASVKGGEPPIVRDADDMREFDYAFLNHEIAMKKVKYSMPIEDVNEEDYEAIFFVGGKGAMFDFPANEVIKHIVKNMYQQGKVISGVCHGPAALVDVVLDNGVLLLKDKKVSGFTNREELFLIPGARDVFPFLLEDKMIENGAEFVSGFTYLEQVSVDGKIITGQNPWSTWKASEEVIRALGYSPVHRVSTPEENSVRLLITFSRHGYREAYQHIKNTESLEYDRLLVVMHILVAALKFHFMEALQLLCLASALK